MVRTHQDLEVWKQSISFVTKLYQDTQKFPREELYGLTSQMRRAAVSIPSNIAEGATRKGKPEFKQFLFIALASGAELETQLIIAFNLNFLNEDQYKDLTDKLITIQKMIQGLIKSLG